ncbi:MAG TPA: hypothetical protein VKS81_02705, partial [Bacteroidota bacterium]|nr:hypothetical protein [Bacteroidota bacterium]
MRTIVIVLVSVIFASNAAAQEKLYSISTYGSYTTSSKVFINPDNPDPIINSQNVEIDDIFGYGIDIRRTFPSLGIMIGLNAEYLQKQLGYSVYLDSTGNATVPVTDGFVAIPIEL